MNQLPTYAPFSIQSTNKYSGYGLNTDFESDYKSFSGDNLNNGMIGVSYDDYLKESENDKKNNDKLTCKFDQLMSDRGYYYKFTCADSNNNLMNKLELLMAERDILLSNIKYNNSNSNINTINTRSLPFEPINNAKTDYIIDKDNINPIDPEYLIDVSGNIVSNNITFINNTSENHEKYKEYQKLIEYRTNSQYKSIDDCINALIINSDRNYYKFILLIKCNNDNNDNNNNDNNNNDNNDNNDNKITGIIVVKIL